MRATKTKAKAVTLPVIHATIAEKSWDVNVISQTKNTVLAYVDDLIAARIADPRFRPGMIQQKVQLELALSLVLAREKAQMSRSQLAERTNISERIISQIENGDGNPSLQTLVRLSIALQQPLSVTVGHSL